MILMSLSKKGGWISKTSVSSYNPFLFGKGHYNRLVHDTNMYILIGHIKNYFGTIIRHAPNFNIMSSTPPNLKFESLISWDYSAQDSYDITVGRENH